MSEQLHKRVVRRRERRTNCLVMAHENLPLQDAEHLTEQQRTHAQRSIQIVGETTAYHSRARCQRTSLSV